MLAGTWVGQDGGRFTITQAAGARTVTWVGCSADGGRTWHHTFSGRVVGDSLVGRFQDTPPGASRNQGDLALDIVSEGKLAWIASLSIDGKVTNSFPTATRTWTRGSHGGCTAKAAANFSGDWTWKATNDTTKNVFIGPTPMSILQGAGGVVCSTWSFSGGGSAKGSLSGSTWSASWRDGFGKGAWKLTLTADGNAFKGSQTIDPHGAAPAYKATIEGTRRSVGAGHEARLCHRDGRGLAGRAGSTASGRPGRRIRGSRDRKGARVADTVGTGSRRSQSDRRNAPNGIRTRVATLKGW